MAQLTVEAIGTFTGQREFQRYARQFPLGQAVDLTLAACAPHKGLLWRQFRTELVRLGAHIAQGIAAPQLGGREFGI